MTSDTSSQNQPKHLTPVKSNESAGLKPTGRLADFTSNCPSVEVQAHLWRTPSGEVRQIPASTPPLYASTRLELERQGLCRTRSMLVHRSTSRCHLKLSSKTPHRYLVISTSHNPNSHIPDPSSSCSLESAAASSPIHLPFTLLTPSRPLRRQEDGGSIPRRPPRLQAPLPRATIRLPLITLNPVRAHIYLRPGPPRLHHSPVARPLGPHRSPR